MSDNCKENKTTLVFPSGDDLNGRGPVPRDAMELINDLLQEKEYRLCSKSYSRNDSLQNGDITDASSEKPPQDYQGHYVYPDDAVDIKAHRFFDGLSWDTIHLSRPPFVPDVRSQADTKYFDDDPISDVDDGSSEQDPSDSINWSDNSRRELHYAQKSSISASTKYPEDGCMNNKPMGQFGGDGPYVAADKRTRRREKKRPRDRVLRDKKFGKKVLELRKQGAFLGYAYQRPATMGYDKARGRRGSATIV